MASPRSYVSKRRWKARARNYREVPAWVLLNYCGGLRLPFISASAERDTYIRATPGAWANRMTELGAARG